jgi:hypothetical protein
MLLLNSSSKMLLISLPNEILLKILTDTTILSTTDHLSLSLSCLRLSYLVLPHLFSHINIVDNPQKSNITQRLHHLHTIFTTSPERKSWLHSARISWTGENVQDNLPWMTQAKIYGILTQLPALRSLGIGEKIRESFSTTPNPNPNIIQGPSKLLLNYSNSFHSIRRLELDDFLLTTLDISQFFTWPNLLHFTILNLVMLYSEETLSLSQKSITTPQSNIQILEFRRCQHTPLGPLFEDLLKEQRRLRKLVIETMGYWRSPLAVQGCLMGLKDTLVDLELTTVLNEWSERRGIGVGAMQGNDGTMLDLCEFKVLKKLEACDHLLFAWQQDVRMRVQKWTSYHTLDRELGGRLPASLEVLTVSLPLPLLVEPDH